MIRLIDTTLWIDLTRAKSPEHLKVFVAPYVNDPETRIAEPIMFEMLRYATEDEERLLATYFSTIPFLTTPADLWTLAARLGRACRAKGHTPGSLDLLIAQVAIQHSVELVTFDEDFVRIAGVSDLRVLLLRRPTAPTA